MAEHDAQAPVTMEELLVTSDALAKLLIENGLITQAELMTKILEERAVYQRMLKPTVRWEGNGDCRGFSLATKAFTAVLISRDAAVYMTG